MSKQAIMATYERVVERHHGLCLLCLINGVRKRGCEVHHIVPRGKCVGQWRYLREDERNLALLCRECHHPSPSREEAQRMLRFLREEQGYEYDERLFREVLEEMV